MKLSIFDWKKVCYLTTLIMVVLLRQIMSNNTYFLSRILPDAFEIVRTELLSRSTYLSSKEVFTPLSIKDLQSPRYLLRWSADENHMEQTREAYPTASTSLFDRIKSRISRFIKKGEDIEIVSEVSPKFNNPNTYPIYNVSYFNISNPEIMNKYPTEPSIILTFSFYDKNEVCSLDISNILPSVLSPRKNSLSSICNNGKKCHDSDRAEEIISAREHWAKDTEAYAVMRREAASEVDSVLPRDHVEVGYTRKLYLEVHALEDQVIAQLMDRIHKLPCFQSCVKKYDDMNKEVVEESTGTIEAKQTALTNGERWMGSAAMSVDEVDKRYSILVKSRASLRINLFSSVRYYSDVTQLCDGCDIKKGIKHYELTESFPNHVVIRKWIGDDEVFDVSTSNNRWYPSSGMKSDVTGIVVGTNNRLFSIRQFVYRWRGPLVILIQCLQVDEVFFIDYLNSHHFPKRITIMLYLTDSFHPHSFMFPVNYLRNLAIYNIRTTHFLVLDMDLRVSINTYEEVQKIPRRIMESNNSAIILPIFFYNHTTILNNCISVEDCAALTTFYQPENKAELIACVSSGNCFSNKRLVRTHMYIMPEWFVTSQESPLSRIMCFITNFMEPYVIVRFNRETPLFHEKFVDYGYNKVAYIEHIRQAGYIFYILNHAFAMDYPHMDSDFRTKYHDVLHSSEMNPMKSVYNDLQTELTRKYLDVDNCRVCFLRQLSYYAEEI